MSNSEEFHVSPTSTPVESRGNGDQARWRRVLTLVLVILTSVSLVSAVVAVWTHQVVFNTDRFMETVEPVLHDQALYDLIGDEVTGEVLTALAIQDRLEKALSDLDSYLSQALSEALDGEGRLRELLDRFDPPSLTQLAPPIANALESRIEARLDSFFTVDRFAEPVTELVRRSHEVALDLIRSETADYPNVYIQDDEVRVNLVGVVVAALRGVRDDIEAVLPDIHLPDAVSDEVQEGIQQLAAALQVNLPDDFGQVTIMSRDVLARAQDMAERLDRYAWGSVILTVVLLILTLVLSTNRRRTLFQLGIGIFVAVIVAAVTIRQLESAIVATILDPRGSALAGDVVGDVLSGLRTIEVVLAVGAILLAIVAYLAGRPERFARADGKIGQWTAPSDHGSRLDNWVARHAGALQVTGVLIAAVSLFFVGIDWISIVVIGGLLATYLLAVTAASRRASEAGEEALVD